MQSYRGIPESVIQEIEKELNDSYNVGTILHNPQLRSIYRSTYGIYGDSADRFQWIMTYGLRGF